MDLESLKRIIDLFIGAGVNGLTALGVTSEIGRMNDSERVRVLETVVRHVDARVRVVAGAAADGVGTCIGYTKPARETGADAVMISPPRAPKVNSDAVVRHFAADADAVEIPIVIQDYPPISGFAMEPWLLVRIAREVAAANTIKLEDPLSVAKLGLHTQDRSLTVAALIRGPVASTKLSEPRPGYPLGPERLPPR